MRRPNETPAASRPGDHPEPRPGIDASNVLTAEDLADAPDVIPVYDGIREMPHIADGLRCYCGCADWEGYRSLLTCFEGNGMAMSCDQCLAQAELAHRRWTEGQSLDQIRRAIDARFAPPGG
ncbi:MAG: PCYCGC motif-containing (lipo)protein [Gemmatimonadota bacterium]